MEHTNANWSQLFCALLIANEMGMHGESVGDFSVCVRDNEIRVFIPNSSGGWRMRPFYSDLKAALDLSKGERKP